MNLIDAVVILVVVVAGIGGWRLGFLTRVTSWVGLAVGLVAGVVALRWIVDRWGRDGSFPVAILALGVLLLAAVGGQAVGFAVGGRLRRPVRSKPAVVLDRMAGAAAGVLGALVLLWLLVPVVTGTGGWIGRETRNAAIPTALTRHLPAPPDAVAAARDALGADRFPVVFEGTTPSGPTPPPPAATGLTDAQADVTAASVVRIEGVACDELQDGTGWVVAPETVVTNAHVVAGEADTDVIRDDGRTLTGTVVAFDPSRDVAVVRVPGLGRTPLPTAADAGPGTVGGVFGHPGGGPLRIAPFSVVNRVTALGRDIYDRPGARREIFELASALRPGDSGSPVVAADGRVAGMAFAISRDRSGLAYALTIEEVQAVVDGAGTAPAATGACVA